MRVKTVPRHLPRKVKAASSSNSSIVIIIDKSTISEDDCQVQKKVQKGVGGQRNGGLSVVKTVNFTTLGDIVEQVMDQGISKLVSDEDEEEEEKRLQVLDLSMKSKEEQSLQHQDDRLKETYLYQLMTDPDFLQRVQKAQAAMTKRTRAASCPYCKKEFDSESELKVHLNKQVSGADSGRRLPQEQEQKQELPSTTTTRRNNQQLSCCACGKSFAQKRYLRYHQRSHSERSKYSCDICTRKYSRLDNLTRHNIFHTNPDKFPCNSCDRTFARKDLLNKHLKCHENKYKYHCDICQKYFKGPLSLDNHAKLFHAARAHRRLELP